MRPQLTAGGAAEQTVLALLEPCLSMTLRVRHDPLPAGWQVSPARTANSAPQAGWQSVCRTSYANRIQEERSLEK